jgi:aminopeptidase
MDPRVREHAETLVDWSARIEADDNVVVSVALFVGVVGAVLL